MGVTSHRLKEKQNHKGLLLGENLRVRVSGRPRAVWVVQEGFLEKVAIKREEPGVSTSPSPARGNQIHLCHPLPPTPCLEAVKEQGATHSASPWTGRPALQSLAHVPISQGLRLHRQQMLLHLGPAPGAGDAGTARFCAQGADTQTAKIQQCRCRQAVQMWVIAGQGNAVDFELSRPGLNTSSAPSYLIPGKLLHLPKTLFTRLLNLDKTIHFLGYLERKERNPAPQSFASEECTSP